MKILLDACLPKRLKSLFQEFNVRTVPEMGWATFKNGELLRTAVDVLGKEIAVLTKDEFVKAGSYTVTWDASNYPSGTYFYRFTPDDFAATRRMVLAK